MGLVLALRGCSGVEMRAGMVDPSVSGAKQVLSLEERKRAIEDQMELDALKAKQRTQQAQGAVGLLRGVAQAARRAPPTTGASELASIVPPSARGQGQAEPDSEEQEVSAMAAAPLSELLPLPTALPMAWPSEHVTEQEGIEARLNGSRRQRP
jgi:hypothetical protein